VINFLLSNTADQNSGVSYIYCDYQEAESLKASAIIGTLVRQLLSRRMDIPIDIENRMEEIVDRHPDCEDMLGLLVIMAKKFSTLYIVIDGIDECDPEQRAEVLTAFTELLNLGQPVVKIFTSSRMTEDIQHACENYGLIRFTEQTIAPDISRVVRETVRSKLNSGHLKLRNSDLAELIISKLIDGAGGM